jgi:hypothetical protein
MTNANLMEIREEGFRVLVKGLGAAGAAHFLRQFGGGSGDYTRDRGELLDGITIDEIAARIQERKKRLQ